MFMATQYATDNEQSVRAVFESFSSGNPERMRDLYAEDVVLRSPITDRFQFRGRDKVLEIASIVRSVSTDVEQLQVIGSGDRWVQIVRARTGGKTYEMSEMIAFDESGKIVEFTVFIRPLPALAAFLVAVAPLAAGRRSRTAGLAMGAMARPLVPLTDGGDRIAVAMLRKAWS
jgi:ketosteroid isomerase-like protein